MTVIQELISEFEEIKKTKCKTLQEVIFFDGVLAIIEGKYLKKEQEQDKNKYSEKEVIKFGQWLTLFDNLRNENKYVIKQLLKQFKKK